MEAAAKRGCIEDDQPFVIGRGAHVILSPNAQWVMQHHLLDLQEGVWRKAFVSTNQGKKATIVSTKLQTITSGEWSPDSECLAFGGQGKVYVLIKNRCMKIRVPNGRVHQVWWANNTCLKVATQQKYINTYEIVHHNKVICVERKSFEMDRGSLVFGDNACVSATIHASSSLFMQLKTDCSFDSASVSGISQLNSLAVSRNGKVVIASAPEGLIVFNPKGKTPLVLCDEFQACNLCAISPSGNSYIFTSRNHVFGIANDVVVHNISFDPTLSFTALYFTSEKTYVVILQHRDDKTVKVARHTLS